MSATLLLPGLILFLGLFIVVGNEEPAQTLSSKVEQAQGLAMECIRTMPRGSMVIFDFDHTLFNPDIIVDHVYVTDAHQRRRAIPIYKPIVPMCLVLQFAVSRGMYVTMITARPDTATSKRIVLENFRRNGMQLHEYHANPNYPKMNNFKAEIRSKISKIRPIALTIGDQWTDVNEATYHFIKLPTARDPILRASLSPRGRRSEANGE